MSGGIIIQRAQVLLGAAQESCMYNSMSPYNKSRVDSIAAKDPDQRTEHDCQVLVHALHEAVLC